MSATTPGAEPGRRVDWWGVFALLCLACSCALSGWLAWQFFVLLTAAV